MSPPRPKHAHSLPKPEGEMCFRFDSYNCISKQDPIALLEGPVLISYQFRHIKHVMRHIKHIMHHIKHFMHHTKHILHHVKHIRHMHHIKHSKHHNLYQIKEYHVSNQEASWIVSSVSCIVACVTSSNFMHHISLSPSPTFIKSSIFLLSKMSASKMTALPSGWFSCLVLDPIAWILDNSRSKSGSFFNAAPASSNRLRFSIRSSTASWWRQLGK